MGNRVVVVFHANLTEFSPCIYMHNGGHMTPTLLARLRERMRGREGDLSYTAARFVGLAHDAINGNGSLGIWNNPHVTGPEALKGQCPGDAGVVLVDVNSWKVQRLTHTSWSEMPAPAEFTAGEVEFKRPR